MSADEWAGIRVYMKDRAKFKRDAYATAADIDRMGRATDRFGGSTKEAARRSFLMNQALFTMRRLAYGATLGLGALATTSIAFGLRFNASMETTTVAMAQFLGSTGAARRELAYLYRLAKFTPFEFRDVTEAATQFLSFGYSVKQTNEYLRILGDTIAGIGLAGGDVKRIAIIFGQIRASGRLLGQDLLQLTQARIPALEILVKQLNLSRAQQQQLLAGSLRIPSEVAIPALMRGLQERFGGAAEAQSKTFTGQLSTLRDNISQFLGKRTQGLFEWLRTHALPTLNQMFAEFDRGRGPLADFARLWREGLAPGLKLALILFLPLLPILRSADDVLAVLSHHTTLVKLAVGLLTAALVLNVAAWTLFSLRTALAGVSLFRLTRQLALARVAVALYKLWVLRAEYAQLAAARATRIWAAAQLLLIRGLRLAAVGMVGLNLALFANPIGLIVAAVIGLIAVFGLLYWKVGWFRDGVNAAFCWIKSHWPLLAGIMVGPIGIAVVLILKNFARIKQAALAVWNSIKGLFGKIGGAFKAVLSRIPGGGAFSFVTQVLPLPHLASGGNITSLGSVLVGERGPEVLTMPRGATVTPLAALPALPALSAPAALPSFVVEIIDNRPIELEIDGQKVAVAVAKHGRVLAEAVAGTRLERKARL